VKDGELLEQPLPYFSKLTAQAIREQNWDLLSRMVDLIRQTRLEDVANPLDLCGLESFLGARQFANAGEPEFAVAMYVLALNSGCQVLPIDLSEHILARSKRRSKNPSVKRPIRSVAPE